MFNVAVLKMRDIIKYFIGIIITVLMVVLISRNFNKDTKEEKIVQEVKSGVRTLSQNSMLNCIEHTMPVVADLNKEYNDIAKEDDIPKNQDFLEGILKSQLSSIKGIEKIEEKNIELAKNQATTSKTQQENKEEQVTVAETGLTTQVVTNNPISENYNVQYGKVKIKNQTNYQLTEEMMTPNITIENKNVLIFHTHSCESYTSSQNYSYTPTGTFRTTDLNFTVTRVGTELENQLKQYNRNVIHNTNYHDYPSYNGSYTRSLATVENILKTNQADIIIDLHRDAIGSRSDYAPSVKIGENDIAAQIMFVIGTNGGGLWHPNWNQNLKFAIKVQEKAEEMYPGLFKPIMLTNSRYNQHTGKYANIIEVGATGNTLEQCLTSMKYLAKVMDEVMK
ncbi:MAG: stage II sporulation protein P [Clostridia bacterium]|nr:stage II sporulation protein P [Clostridia bacterium]